MTTPHDQTNPYHHAHAHGPAVAPGSLRCPECGEPARPVPPRRWPLDGFASRPATSHHDGTPLCPVPGPHGSQPAEPIATPTQARLTIWQAVRQSWLIHPDWTVADHLAWLNDEAYNTGTLTGDPAEVVGRWLAEHRRTASMSRPADEARVYMVACGDRVAVFDSADEAGVTAATMTGGNLEPVTLCLTEAQWDQAHAVLRAQRPHIAVTDARSGRAAGAS
ncbi:hypothetical protein [Micromonospora andamanensis]|uniref:hypothetical protein n=1 Tax=Micromonospora andamanensis TaxID=1287068 RepID=UPI00194FEFF2|nr:hypothetical protein [Micromonospora andamanensis]